MQLCSDEYKREMMQPFRRRSFIRVNLGVIHQEAQSNVKAQNIGEYEYYSNLEKLFKNYEVELPYANLEKSATKVDGTMYFLPKNIDSEHYFNQGIVSSGSNIIRFSYDDLYDIKGLTLDFSEVYPVDFDIVTNNKVLNIRANNKRIFVTTEVFENTEFIEIRAVRMLYIHNRLRLYKAIMGVGIYFDNKNIISATKKEHISPIMENLHTLDLNLKIENRNRAYDVENKDSAVNFLEIGQKINISYGYELNSSRIEWIDGCDMRLRTWNCDDVSLNLTASDVFDDMNAKYYRGIFNEKGISLYDLAIDVLVDAGIDNREYQISSYLKRVLIKNPIPLVTHKEALQLIANAGRCLLYQDRNGKIVIKPDFIPNMRVNAYGEISDYSNAGNILLNNEIKHYAFLNSSYTKVDDSMYFLPKDTNNILATGYISGNSSNKKIVINFDAEYTFFNLSLIFSEVAPLEILIKTYKGVNLIQSFSKTDLNIIEDIKHQFIDIDKIEVYFVRIKPNTRVILDKVILGDRTDYVFEYSKNLKSYPKGALIEKIKCFNMFRTSYLPSEENEKELINNSVTQIEDKEYIYYFNNPSYDFRVEVYKGEVSQAKNIIYSSNYMIKIRILGEGIFNIRIFGKEYTVNKQIDTQNINPVGVIKKWDNPLISDISHSSVVGRWVVDYMGSDIEYTLSDRGEPRIDVGDITFLEHRYLGNIGIKILDYTLSFNGGLSGSVKARKVGTDVAGA